jgi:hypothetical protein
MELPEAIKDKAKKTIGYAESPDKHSFKIGAEVAFRISEEYYRAQIGALTIERDRWKSAHKKVSGEIKTVATIIGNYMQDGD